MTEPDPFVKQPAYGQPTPGYGQPVPGYGQPPTGYGQPGQLGPIGEVRSTGLTILLFVVTLGIWSFIYFFKVHEEMKQHTGRGLGGGIALLLALVSTLFVGGVISPFLQSDEVGKLDQARGQKPRVTALTGLWFFPGIFILVGPLIWFVKTNNALNDYWRSVGAQG